MIKEEQKGVTLPSEKISVLDHGFVRLIDAMGNDQSIVRAARVSYDAAWRAGENEGSDTRLIRYLLKNAHTTPFEAVTLTFEIKAPIFVFRQWHRHRTWCLSGDTLISFETPCKHRKGIRVAKKLRLDDLYRKWSNNPPVKRDDKQKRSLRDFNQSRIKGMLLRVYDEVNKEFTTGSISDITTSGMKPIFEIETDDGKTLKCSRDHRLLTTSGWQRLEDAVGLVVHGKTAGMTREAHVLCNGLPAYQQRDWMETQRAAGRSVSEISEAAGISYHTVRKWLKILDLKFSKEERSFSRGNTPWNKNVTGYKNNMVMTDAQKAVIRAARSGEKSNWWMGGVTTERAAIARWTSEQAPKVHQKFNYYCQKCGKNSVKLDAHHIKPVVKFPEFARDFDNLVSVCRPCHRAIHFQNGEMRMGKGVTLTARPRKIVKIRYVGEEVTYDISVKGPHHNFVANGLIVHNSFNELSGRYRELPEEFHVPDPSLVGTQATVNKQGRDISQDSEALLCARRHQTGILRRQNESAFSTYRELMTAGWPRELARSVLPVGTYSHMFATVNLLNLFRFLTLRLDPHAQHEIRVYAEAMLRLIEGIVPVAVEAFRDYGMCSTTLSAEMIRTLKLRLSGAVPKREETSLTPREWSDLMAIFPEFSRA